MDILQVILRIAHIAPAIVLGGAAIFRLVAVQPVLQTLDPTQRQALSGQFIRRWIVVLWACIVLLLLSGLLNFLLYKLPAVRGQPFAGLYHGLLGLKIIAALAVFHAAAVVTMPGAHFERYRARAPFWLGLATGLVGLIIVLAAILRYLPTFYT